MTCECGHDDDDHESTDYRTSFPCMRCDCNDFREVCDGGPDVPPGIGER